MIFTELTAAYLCLIAFAAYSAWCRKCSIVWSATGVMICTVLVEQVSMGTGLHYLCVGLIPFLAALMIPNGYFRIVFFWDAAINWAYQALWIAGSYDIEAYRHGLTLWDWYPAAMWTLNCVLALLICRVLQGPKTGGTSGKGNSASESGAYSS